MSWLFDDFSSGSALDSAVWQSLSSSYTNGGYLLSAVQQLGSLCTPTVTGAGHGNDGIAPATAPTFSDYSVIAVVKCGAGGSFTLYIGLRATPESGYSAEYVFLASIGAGTCGWQLLKDKIDGTGYNAILSGSTGTNVTGLPISYPIVVSIASKTITVSINGTVYGTWTDPETTGGSGSGPAISGPGLPYFGIDSSTSTAIGIDSIAIDSLIVPAFWTNFVETTEVDV